MKIYTKTGDCGTTGLFAGPRVSKDHPRIQAYGAVDELSALLGVVVVSLAKHAESENRTDRSASMSIDSVAKLLRGVQSDLFCVGAELATPDPVSHNMSLLKPEQVEQLERWIDRVDEQLAPLKCFILPGGSQGSAMLHLARTVCRRAERDIVHLTHTDDVRDCSLILIYLNRLSDLLFVLARHINSILGVADTPWQRPT